MLEEGMLVEWRDAAERGLPADADGPILELAGQEARDVVRRDPAVDDRRLAGSLDLDVRLHPHGAVAADLANDGVRAASASRQAASTRRAPLGIGRAVDADADDEAASGHISFPALSGGLLELLEVGAVSRSPIRSWMCSPRRPDDERPASCHRPAIARANGLVELLDREIAEEVGVELADRRAVADAEAAVDDLDGQLAVGRRIAVGDPPDIFQILDQTL